MLVRFLSTSDTLKADTNGWPVLQAAAWAENRSGACPVAFQVTERITTMTQRQCGPCTKCCEGWVTAKINGVSIVPLKPCAFLTNKGCGVYEKRPPVPCRSFKCGWLSDSSPLPEHMSPVNCGAIILFDRKWQGRTIISALPTGPKIPQETLDWLMAYAQEKNIPLRWFENVFKDNAFFGRNQIGFGPPAFVEAVKNAVTKNDLFM